MRQFNDNGLLELSVNKELDPDLSDFGSPDRLTVWRSRSIAFKLKHRWNVLRAFARCAVSFHSFYLGQRFAHCVVALAPRTPGVGMVYVCPAWISHLDELAVGPLTQRFAPNQPTNQPKKVKHE